MNWFTLKKKIWIKLSALIFICVERRIAQKTLQYMHEYTLDSFYLEILFMNWGLGDHSWWQSWAWSFYQLKCHFTHLTQPICGYTIKFQYSCVMVSVFFRKVSRTSRRSFALNINQRCGKRSFVYHWVIQPWPFSERPPWVNCTRWLWLHQKHGCKKNQEFLKTSTNHAVMWIDVVVFHNYFSCL